LVAVVVTGGAIATTTGLRTGQAPGPVASPVAATPGRTTPVPREITEKNLIRLDDIPANDIDTYQVARPDSGRALNKISVCVRGKGWGSLGASSVLSRSFVLGRDFSGVKAAMGPKGQPTTYSVALQFSDAAAAEQAAKTLRSWVDRCEKTLQGDPAYRQVPELDTSTRWKPHWVPVKSGGRTVAAFTDVPLYELASDTTAFYVESVGISQVDDRLAVVVEIAVAQEYPYGSAQDLHGYAQDDPERHPEFALLLAATRALSR
jgi:hypothetical protein